MYEFLYTHVFSVLLDMYLGVEMLGHVVVLPNCFLKGLHYSICSLAMHESFNFSFSPTLAAVLLEIFIAILVGVK